LTPTIKPVCGTAPFGRGILPTRFCNFWSWLNNDLQEKIYRTDTHSYPTWYGQWSYNQI